MPKEVAKIDLEYLTEREETEETPPQNFATVGAVYADGLSLIFDGEAAPSEKHYRCNTSIFFQPGDRVRIFKDSGTYVVEYVVGTPAQTPTVGIPSGGAKNQVLTKTDAADYDADWRTPSYVPTTGTTGHVLTKTATGAEFQAAPSGLPSGGSTGQVLKKTATGAAWANETTELPSGGSTGQVLKKTASGSEWGDYVPSSVVNGTSGTLRFEDRGTVLRVYVNGASGYKIIPYDPGG